MCNKFMNSKCNSSSKDESIKQHSKESRNSQTGYMDRGNSSKIAAKQGTRNK